MATSHSNKGKGNSGLRILWIPGRKRHNRKGQYDSTNKKIDYNAQQKRNQQWSLGGSKTHEKLSGNFSDAPDVTPACTIAATCVAGAGVLHKADDESPLNDIKEDTKQPNGNKCTNEEDLLKNSLASEKKMVQRQKTDEKIVNYIYYSLMCCECSIS